MLNNNERITSAERLIIESLRETNYIVIINKTDLDTHIELDTVKKLAKGKPVITTSIIQDEGIEALEMAIYELFFSVEVMTNDATFVKTSLDKNNSYKAMSITYRK